LVAGAYTYQAFLFHRYILDDAFITFRYSRALAVGRGPYFNPGEHVEGYTNFLFMLLSAPIIYLGGPGAAVPASKAIGFVAGAVSLLSVFATTCCIAAEDVKLLPHRALPALLAAGLSAVNPTTALHAMSGLETSFYTGLLSLGIWLDVSSARDGRWRGAGIAFGAAALTRPEGIFIVGWYWSTSFVARLIRRGGGPGTVPPLRVIDVALPVAMVAAHLAFRILAYDHEVLPNTFFAKTGGFVSYDRVTYVRDGLRSGFFGIGGITLSLAGWLVRRDGWRLALPSFVAGMIGVLLPLVTGSDWMLGWRLMQPFFPMLMAVMSVGWVKILVSGERRIATAAYALVLSALAIATMLHEPDRRSFSRHVTLDADEWPNSYGVLIRYLCEEHRGSERIALMDIGKVGYYCFDRPVLDITGLTDRHIAKSPGAFLSKEYDPRYVFDRSPEYVVIRTSERPDPENTGRTIVAPYTLIEARILGDPDFTSAYGVQRSAPRDSASPAERIVDITGAERVIPHRGPDGIGYFLVFRRQGVPGA
jgi:hypothetical protein